MNRTPCISPSLLTILPDDAPASDSMRTGINYIDSRQLLGSKGILMIQHDGQFYQLRETKTGKLILTK